MFNGFHSNTNFFPFNHSEKLDEGNQLENQFYAFIYKRLLLYLLNECIHEKHESWYDTIMRKHQKFLVNCEKQPTESIS